MRNLLLFCTFAISVLFMNAQQNNFECATVETSTPDAPGVYSYSNDITTLDNMERVVLNIKFWGINYPNGINDFPNRAHDALQAVANLNIAYNRFGIYFKYRGFEEFDSPALPNDPNGFYILENTSQYTAMLNWTAANGYKDGNAINVYAFGWASFAGGIASGYLNCAVGSNGLADNILVHEVSHNLTLRHTRSANEHTTRDPNDPNFNATTAGDRVVDTAANSGFWDYSCDCAPYIDPLTCTYFGKEKDELDFPYKIYHEDVINIMANAYGVCWENSLTSGQGIRAREAIANGHFDVALTTLASLYEPYAGEYFVTRPPGPGTVDELAYRPLFQPGFNYRFVECCCGYPEPSDYNDTSFSHTNNSLLTISKYETDFNKITHPNHTAIYIDFQRLQAPNQDTRRCYDNWNRRPIMGTLVKFNDNVFNANVTITQKDSLGINNPNLINEMESGLYKIEKKYEDGGVQESIIFKEN